MKKGTPRPNNGAKVKNGTFVVPPEIRALKPKDPPSTIKKSKNGYYVVERLRVPDPDHPGKMKNASGKTLGHIIDMKYVPLEEQIKDVCDEDPDILNYGAYAVAIASSKDVLPLLKKRYSARDSINIYVIALIYAVNHYVPARDLHELYIQSVLCKLYPQATLSENTVGKFIEDLGQHGKKRLHIEQDLINEGSGCYNIDGHVMLCVSNCNELADYGAKYDSIGNTQANFMMVYDAKKKRAVSCDAFEGGIPDKTAVKNTFAAHKFEKSRFRIDSGFYGEDNFALYRANECTFVIPIPGTTIIKKTIVKHLSFSGSFVHKRQNKHGKTEYSAVQYMEYTVKKLEEIAVQDAKDDADAKNEELKQQAKSDEKIKKVYPKKIERSAYPDDRVFVYKDQLMHDKLYFDYTCLIGDGKHTEEKLRDLEVSFGVIALRTNDPQITAEDLYLEYKDRWPIETYYNYLKNVSDFKALHEENYFTQQGVGFLMVIESLIHSEMEKRIKATDLPYVHNMSIDECIRIAGRSKIAQHPDLIWYCNVMKGKIVDFFEYMEVDVKKDLAVLNASKEKVKVVS